MLRAPLSFLILSAAASAQPSQAAAPPADTLQALLAEVHQLRLDLQSTNVTAQRVQILLYRVQLQQATAARVASRADETHSRLAGAQQNRGRATQDMQRLQELIAANTDATRAPQLQLQAADIKQQLEMWQFEEQQWQAKDVEAQSQLRAEQARLDELQGTLDRLDKALAGLAKQ